MNLSKLLPKMFEQLDKAFTGYSHSASIMRHGNECGASACTAIDRVTMQDLKADAVWLFERIKFACTEYEVCLIIASHGEGFSLFGDAIKFIKSENEHYKLHDELIDLYFHASELSLRQIAIKHDVTYKTAQCAREKLFKVLDNERMAAERAIEKGIK